MSSGLTPDIDEVVRLGFEVDPVATLVERWRVHAIDPM